MSLVLQDVSVRYRQAQEDGEHVLLALDHVDLELIPGNITALVGESGCGKTTLAKAIMGLLPGNAMQSGRILLDGEPLPLGNENAMNKVRWRRIAMVFQNGGAGLHPIHTVLDQLIEPMRTHLDLQPDDAKSKARALLEQMGLPWEIASRHPHELSGGQSQRCFLAMALALDPDYLLLDEPTASLDPGTRAFLLQRLRELRSEGKGILLITHDLGSTASLADDTKVMYLGNIMEEISGSLLTREVRHPYSRGLVRAFPGMFATRELGGLRGEPLLRITHAHATSEEAHHKHTEPNIEHAPEEGCLFLPRCTQACQDCSSGRIALAGAPGSGLRCIRGGIVPFLELNDIRKRYSSAFALQDIQMRIMAGETFCLVGETGSGKSTLAKIITGELEADGGTASLDGSPLDYRRHRRRLAAKIGFVAQNPLLAVSPLLTVFDIAAEPLRILMPELPRSDLEKRVLSGLSEVRLPDTPDFLKLYPNQLNAGALQRLCLARALMTRPSLLVADEPTSSLDPSVQAKILRMLLELQTERGLTMLFVTHDFGIARKIADHIGVMHDGRLVETGTTRTILTHPAHEHTRFLLSCARGENLQGE